jgi:hypothetical protein
MQNGERNEVHFSVATLTTRLHLLYPPGGPARGDRDARRGGLVRVRKHSRAPPTHHTADRSYLIIESSGISEPIQVAETFTQEFAETMAAPVEEIEAGLPEDKDQSPESRKRLAELIAAGGLSKVAKLDCCVSMVDCTTFMDDFDTTDFLTDRHGKEVAPEDERNITDLCVQYLAEPLRLSQTNASLLTPA